MSKLVLPPRWFPLLLVLASAPALAEPEPVVRLHTLGESSVDFVVRPWARTSDYWTVYWDVTRSVKDRPPHDVAWRTSSPGMPHRTNP